MIEVKFKYVWNALCAGIWLAFTAIFLDALLHHLTGMPKLTMFLLNLLIIGGTALFVTYFSRSFWYMGKLMQEELQDE